MIWLGMFLGYFVLGFLVYRIWQIFSETEWPFFALFGVFILLTFIPIYESFNPPQPVVKRQTTTAKQPEYTYEVYSQYENKIRNQSAEYQRGYREGWEDAFIARDIDELNER